MNLQLAPSRQTADVGAGLPQLVDDLTAVQVEIAVLEAREANLKATLVASGLSEVCGTKTRATISVSKASVTVSWQAVAKALNPSDELLAKHSKPKDPVTSVTVRGYN